MYLCVARVCVRFKNKTANTYQNIKSKKETDEKVSHHQLVCAVQHLRACVCVYVVYVCVCLRPSQPILVPTYEHTYVPYVFTPFELFVY